MSKKEILFRSIFALIIIYFVFTWISEFSYYYINQSNKNTYISIKELANFREETVKVEKYLAKANYSLGERTDYVMPILAVLAGIVVFYFYIDKS